MDNAKVKITENAGLTITLSNYGAWTLLRKLKDEPALDEGEFVRLLIEEIESKLD